MYLSYFQLNQLNLASFHMVSHVASSASSPSYGDGKNWTEQVLGLPSQFSNFCGLALVGRYLELLEIRFPSIISIKSNHKQVHGLTLP